MSPRIALLTGALLAGACTPGADPQLTGSLDLDHVIVTRDGPVDDPTPPAVTYHVDVDGVPWALDLVRADDLFAPTYAEVVRGTDGLSAPPLAEWASALGCYYQGTAHREDLPRVDPSASAKVAVRTCDATGAEALTGMVVLDGVAYDIAPSGGGDDYTLSPANLHAAGLHGAWCGVNDDAIAAPMVPGVEVALERRNDVAWMSLYVASDEAQLAANGGSVGATTTTAADIVNMVAVLYGTQSSPAFAKPVRVVLAGQEVWTTNPLTPIITANGEIDKLDLLADLHTWAGTAGLPNHDFHALFSAKDFSGTAVGLASLDWTCASTQAPSIDQVTQSPAANAVVVAHELGHNLGAQHDDPAVNGCATTGAIMAASVSSPPPTHFSACSVNAYINATLTDPTRTCLGDMPTPVYGGPACGNGVVESGESCDCGPAGCAYTDPCCDGATCQLAAGAQCSAIDACCDPGSCQISAAATVCRAANEAGCDVPETCDGLSPTCPEDTLVAAGTACTTPFPGVCYQGKCESNGRHCADLQASYGVTLTATSSCDATTPACGQLTCVYAGSCLTLNDLNNQPVLRRTGTACGPGQQCQAGACVPSTTLACRPGDDTDLDGVCNAADNCPTVANADQADVNGDSFGDACVALSATITGSSLARGAVVRANAVVGVGALVESGATIRAGAIVGRLAVIHVGAVVGDGAVVAPRAVVGVNTVIGAGALVGRGASVGAGTHLGDGALLAPRVQVGGGGTYGPQNTFAFGSSTGTGVRTGANAHFGPWSLLGDGSVAGDSLRLGRQARLIGPVSAGSADHFFAKVTSLGALHVGDNTTVRRGATLRVGATLGSLDAIGPGALIGAGATLGDAVLARAGATVTDGASVPSGTQISWGATF